MDLDLMHSVGNLELMKLSKTAFLCSRNAPPAAKELAVAWAGERRAAGGCIVSGFHSPIEKEVLRLLLPGTQPLIVILARGLREKVEPELAGALEAGRLLVLTRYAPSVTHASEESCHQRNRLMMELAAEVVVGFVSPGGKLERLCREYGATRAIRLLSPLPAGALAPPP